MGGLRIRPPRLAIRCGKYGQGRALGAIQHGPKRSGDGHIDLPSALALSQRDTLAVSRMANKSVSLPRKTNFAKQKTKKAAQKNDGHVIKATKEANMQHLTLLAVLSVTVIYLLIIVGCLCYVGRHGRR